MSTQAKWSELPHSSSCRELLMSMIPAALYRAENPGTGRHPELRFLNNKIEEILGYDMCNFEDDPLFLIKVMHPEDKQRYEETEVDEVWNGDRTVLEHRFLDRRGRYRWLRRHLWVIRDDGGEMLDAVGCAFDITDLKQAESNLLNFLELAPDPVITVNRRGEIVLANVRAEGVFGYTRRELIGQHFCMLIPEDVRDSCAERFEQCLGKSPSELGSEETELRCLCKNGEEFPAELRLSLVENDREELILFAIRDISRRKRTEAQLRQAQKMEAVGQLTGGIAHDFNNLLTVIIGNLDLLLSDLRDESALQGIARDASDAALRGADLTARLLAYSRQRVLSPRTVDVNEMVNGIEPLLRRTLGADIEVRTQLAPDLWFARIDPSEIENAVINLAINARDAMPDGGTLTIETGNASLDDDYCAMHGDVKTGDYVLITVSDSGTGIAKKVLPHVFEPFFSTKDTGKGSGLGLSMVYGFVMQSAGHIKIYSEEGHGTTIRLYLPRNSHSEAKADTGAQLIVESLDLTGNETILVVEDDPAVRRFALTYLIELGYDVHFAGNGSEALDRLNELENVDLLFTDMIMPGGITGTELSTMARGLYPKIEILYTTGYSNTAVFDCGLVHENKTVLNKPYGREDLARAVREALGR